MMNGTLSEKIVKKFSNATLLPQLPFMMYP